jgi:hypothetical protein
MDWMFSLFLLHSFVLQLVVRTADVLVQAAPPYFAGVEMTYTEVLVPLPQVLEHTLGADQLPTQLIGHGEVLQLDVRVAEVFVQAAPPNAADVKITYIEVVVPVPQVLEHVPEACQLPTQLIGHGEVLQLVVMTADVLVQAAPPYFAGVVMVYTEVLVPLPQVLEHAPGADQLPTQLIGHGCVLQVAVITAPAFTQVVPPYEAGVDITNTATLIPPSHDLVQLPGGCQYPTQLIGQGVVLQTLVAVADGFVQAVPPY